MERGEFLENFFSSRGVILAPNGANEVSVLCPFIHDKNKTTESRPSAHVNVKKHLFHCATCQAEGRFNEGGLSEVGFMAEYFNVPYDQAMRLMNTMHTSESEEESAWNEAAKNMLQVQDSIDYLAGRGITLDTIKEYKLGWSGDGIGYPVFIYGQLCDVRTYMPDEKPKMRSRKGASPLLFPFDKWLEKVEEKATILTAGENDALIWRQMGFNAITVTGGEGTFPKVLLGLFKDKPVYICYDCDAPGRKGSGKIAFLLKEAGATVYMVDLGFPGTPDDKDTTDAYVKHGWRRAEFNQVLMDAKPYSAEDYLEAKNEKYPLVDLWNVSHGKYSDRRISSRVILSGVYDQPMHCPTAIEWVCHGGTFDDEGKSPCWSCALNTDRQKEYNDGWWTLEDDNIKDVMKLIDVTQKQQETNIDIAIGRPSDCPNGYRKVRTKSTVYKVVFTPDVETESANVNEDFRASEQYAYTIGLDIQEGMKYRAYFRPNAHPLDGQRVFMIVDRVEESDSAVNMFKLTPQIQESLKVFQGDPTEMMKLRAEMAKDIVGPFVQEMMVYAVDIMFHSPLDFLDFRKKDKKIKGYPEGLAIGDTRTGKSDGYQYLQEYYGIGNFTSVKKATTAGLLGGVEKLPSGGFKVTWGAIPRNNRGILGLDEMSDCAFDVIASLTDMRSSRKAKVSKIAHGIAPANTRLLWISNPRKGNDGHNNQLVDYSSGVKVVVDLVGATEDIARFDFVLLLPTTGEYISPNVEAPIKAHPSQTYKNLIYWVWSRTAEQVTWDEGIKDYVWQISQELNDKYDTDVKFFGAEAWKKLARIAISCAGACFSCSDDGSCIVVRKVHVDWAAAFLTRCYDNSYFRLREYAKDRKVLHETNPIVNEIVAGLCKVQPTIIRTLLETSEAFPKGNLQAISDLDPIGFNTFMHKLTANYLVTVTAQGFRATRRLRKAVDAYRENYERTVMVPINKRGESPI